jgi:hypothetical protein
LLFFYYCFIEKPKVNKRNVFPRHFLIGGLCGIQLYNGVSQADSILGMGDPFFYELIIKQRSNLSKSPCNIFLKSNSQTIAIQ